MSCCRLSDELMSSLALMLKHDAGSIASRNNFELIAMFIEMRLNVARKYDDCTRGRMLPLRLVLLQWSTVAPKFSLVDSRPFASAPPHTSLTTLVRIRKPTPPQNACQALQPYGRNTSEFSPFTSPTIIDTRLCVTNPTQHVANLWGPTDGEIDVERGTGLP